MIEKIDRCKNSSENSSSTKVSEHFPSGSSMSSMFSIFTISSFRSIENKHGMYRGKYCMKEFGKFLREHAMKMNNFK